MDKLITMLDEALWSIHHQAQIAMVNNVQVSPMCNVPLTVDDIKLIRRLLVKESMVTVIDGEPIEVKEDEEIPSTDEEETTE